MAEIPEQPLHELIHDPTHDDLEGKLELIDAHPMVFPESTPESLPSGLSPHRAHTPRRGMRSGTRPASPAPTVISTIPMPRAQRRPTPATAMPHAEDPELTAAELPSTERPTLPEIPRLAMPANPSALAEPCPVMAHQALPPIDNAPSEPLLPAATPRWSIPLNVGRVHLVLPIVLVLLTFGTMALLLLR